MIVIVMQTCRGKQHPTLILTSPTGNFKTYMLHTTDVLPAKFATYIPSKGVRQGSEDVGVHSQRPSRQPLFAQGEVLKDVHLQYMKSRFAQFPHIGLFSDPLRSPTFWYRLSPSILTLRQIFSQHTNF